MQNAHKNMWWINGLEGLEEVENNLFCVWEATPRQRAHVSPPPGHVLTQVMPKDIGTKYVIRLWHKMCQ